jgi:hypothetical protein
MGSRDFCLQLANEYQNNGIGEQHMSRVGTERIPDQSIVETMKSESEAWVDAEYVPSTF